MERTLRIVVIISALSIFIYASVPAIIALRAGKLDNEIVNPDFETGDLRGWTKTGNAFDYQPTLGDNPKARNRESSNHQGKWWIGGAEKYQGKPGQEPGNVQLDEPTGTLTSAEFIIRGDRISFLIGGGNHPWVEPDGADSTCVNLLVGGKVVKTATGKNYETMSRCVWDVSKLKGKSAVIQLVDRNTEGWGHINFDDLRQMTRWQTEKGNLILYLWSAGLLLIAAFKEGKKQNGKRLSGICVEYIWRLLIALTGILILALSAPHKALNQHLVSGMKYIQSSLAESTLIHVKFSSLDIVFSANALAKSLVLLFIGLFFVTPSVWRYLKSLFRQPWRLIVFLLSLGYLFFTLKPTQDGWGIVLYLALGSVGMTMTFIGISPLVDAKVGKLNDIGKRISRRFNEIPLWLLLSVLFALAFVATNLGSLFIFEHIPHAQDSIDQVFHGKIFLIGKLTVPSPEPREFFNFTHMINNGRWYSQYPPGYSLLMSVGHILHAPWLINPLFGSLCVVLFYFIGKEMYSERIGRLSAFLGVISPFLIFMSSGFMNHTTTLFFVGLFLLGFVRMVKRRRIQDAILSGFALGYALNIRPLTAVAVGAPFVLYAIFKLIWLFAKSRNEVLRFGVLCLVALTVFGTMAGCLLSFNYLTNGDPFLFGYIVLHGEEHGIGFGRRLWGMYTPKKGLTQTLNNFNALNKYLFEIPIPALLFAVLALASPGANVWDLLLIGYGLSLALAYFFYWFQDWYLGPRFMFASTAAFVLLTARGITAIPRIVYELFGITNKRKVKGYIAIVLILCFCLGFASNLPILVKVYSNSYWGVNGRVLKAVKKMGIIICKVILRQCLCR